MNVKAPWLWQILDEPEDPRFGVIYDAFAPTGIRPELRRLFAPVCSFPSMMAAEFEQGALPVAMGRLLGVSRALATFSLGPQQHKANPMRRYFNAPLPAGKKDTRPPKRPRAPAIPTLTLHVLCVKGQQDAVVASLREWLSKDNDETRLKRPVRLWDTLDPLPGDRAVLDRAVKGWFDVESSYFVSPDRSFLERIEATYTRVEEQATAPTRP